MRSNLGRRAFLATAVLLFSIFAASPGAHAAPPDEGEAGGRSADHRNDSEARSQPGPAASGSANLEEPQPASTADFSGNGANDHGAYDSTRDGSASENGNGDGAAVGQPCAGCVGKADNKNPLGQLPNGSDANRGYECDTNRGVGKTNPAHTGCVVASSSNTPTVQPTGSTPTVQTTGAVVLGVVFSAPAAAVAAVAPSTPAPRVAALAVTGAPIFLVLVVGIGLVAVGALLRRSSGRTAKA